MNKREFLTKLKEYLSYELPEPMVRSNIEYYSDYIDTETNKGKGIIEVIDGLGDPQLIARTIVDAAKSGADGIPGTSDDVDFTEAVYGNGRSPEDTQNGRSGRFGQGTGFDSGASDGFGRRTSGGFERGAAEGYGTADGYGQSQRSGQGTGRGTGFRGFGRFSSGPDFGSSRIYEIGCFSVLIVILLIFGILTLIGAIVAPVLAYIGPPLIVVFLIMWLLKQTGGRE